MGLAHGYFVWFVQLRIAMQAKIQRQVLLKEVFQSLHHLKMILLSWITLALGSLHRFSRRAALRQCGLPGRKFAAGSARGQSECGHPRSASEVHATGTHGKEGISVSTMDAVQAGAHQPQWAAFQMDVSTTAITPVRVAVLCDLRVLGNDRLYQKCLRLLRTVEHHFALSLDPPVGSDRLEQQIKDGLGRGA